MISVSIVSRATHRIKKYTEQEYFSAEPEMMILIEKLNG